MIQGFDKGLFLNDVQVKNALFFCSVNPKWWMQKRMMSCEKEKTLLDIFILCHVNSTSKSNFWKSQNFTCCFPMLSKAQQTWAEIEGAPLTL